MHFTRRAVRARMRRRMAGAVLVAAAMVGVSLGYMVDNAGAAAAPYCSGHWLVRIVAHSGYSPTYEHVCVH